MPQENLELRSMRGTRVSIIVVPYEEAVQQDLIRPLDHENDKKIKVKYGYRLTEWYTLSTEGSMLASACLSLKGRDFIVVKNNGEAALYQTYQKLE